MFRKFLSAFFAFLLFSYCVSGTAPAFGADNDYLERKHVIPGTADSDRPSGYDGERFSPGYITISVPGVNIPAVYRSMLIHEGNAANGNAVSTAPVESTGIFKQNISFETLDEEYGENTEKLARATRNYIVAGSMLLITALCFAPPESTKWDDKAVLRDPGGFYNSNITRPPVMDIDPWPMNYIVHPYVGSGYYLAARDTGYTVFESFIYSTLMSTVYWEYGLEAIPERPSIQDLWATPVIGSLLGELFRIMETGIKNNDGRVLNSQNLGSLCRVLLNPARYIGEKMNVFFDDEIFSQIQGNMIYIVRPAPVTRGPLEYFIGLELFLSAEFGTAVR